MKTKTTWMPAFTGMTAVALRHRKSGDAEIC
jgi:hypothetical protein